MRNGTDDGAEQRSSRPSSPSSRKRRRHFQTVRTLTPAAAAANVQLFGHALPPVASGDVSFRYWRPVVAGRAALLVGFGRGTAAFCHGYRVVGRIAMPTANAERGQPIVRCTLDRTLAAAWPQILRFSG